MERKFRKMKFIFSYLKKYVNIMLLGMAVKIAASMTELFIPYIMEHIIDEIVPTKEVRTAILWGILMLGIAVLARQLNITANRMAIRVARDANYDIRKDLFQKSLNLSGSQVDEVGLPSLTSRMTSDSYNLQNFIRMSQTMGIRAPILLVGGIIVTLTMDYRLALILCVMAPVMIAIMVVISFKGIPFYNRVQDSIDDIVRIMRENITGIRVVKALSKEEYERRRYETANRLMEKRDVTAGTIMALPVPFVTLLLNVGLTAVVYVGARLVDAGVTKPGVILAFLTYFNMILMGVMGLSRVFTMMSKANASAERIRQVVEMEDELRPVNALTHSSVSDKREYVRYSDKEDDEKCMEARDISAESIEGGQAEDAQEDYEGSRAYIIFDHVTFNYGKDDPMAGHTRENCLKDIHFSMEKGSSLGIIGATGSGKTTIANLLMRFYDADQGAVYVDGKDVRSYDKDELHRKFGVVFQNDVIFADTLRENVVFGRNVDEGMLERAVTDARAKEFISAYEEGIDHEAVIHGANLSGGQKQRVLIARALAADPEILILDDSSSALDYKTDAELRKAIREHHADTTMIVVAQRISSIMNLDRIIVMEEGQMLGYGTHEELLEKCALYREIYQTQMGESGISA